jgi:O-antigen ligase
MTGRRGALSGFPWRGPTLQFMNAWYNRLYFGGTAAAGPLASVLIHAGLVWGVVRLAIGTFPLIRTHAALIVAAACAALPLAEAASVLANARGAAGWYEVLGQSAFLAVLPVLSRLSVSSPEDVLDDCSLAAAAGGVILLVLSLVQFLLFNLPRTEAGLGNPGVLAVAALLFACMALCGLSCADDRKRALLLSGAACAGGALLLSGMRAVIVVAPVAVLLVLMLQAGQLAGGLAGLMRGRMRVVSVLAALAFATALAVAAPMLAPRIQLAFSALAEVLATGATSDASIGARVELWRSALALIAEDPWFGHGPDTPRALIEAIPAATPLSFSHFHNFILNAMVRGGVIELAAVLAIPVALLFAAASPAATPVQRAGRSLLLALPLVFYVPALVGLLFDHDILNALFIYGAIVGLRLMDPATSGTKPFFTRA